MKAEGEWNGPELEVGQVWNLGDAQVVITGVKGEMTEYQACSGNQAMRRSRGKLATVAELRERLAAAKATLVQANSPLP